MNRLKVMFILATLGSVLTSIAVIALGVYEILIDQENSRNDGYHKGQKIVVTHLLVSLGMQVSANTMILCHIVYITQYVLRGNRYNWHLSCNYFFYIILEIVSVVCVIGKYDYLHYPLALHILTGVLFVMLFFFNCWAVQIFEEIEDRIRTAQQEKKLGGPKKAKVKKVPCVRISLVGKNVNAGATTSTGSGKGVGATISNSSKPPSAKK